MGEQEEGQKPPRPFYELLGIEVVRAADGEATLVLPHHASLSNSRGEIHGGALASLLDAALANCVRSALPAGSGAATVTFTINYLAPARGTVTATGKSIRIGKTIASAEAIVMDATGLTVCHGIGSVRVMRKQAAPQR